MEELVEIIGRASLQDGELLAIANGEYPLNAYPTAYTNAQIAKSGAGVCFGLSGYNSNAAQQFILIFDAARIPAAGATCVAMLQVPGTSNFSVSWSTSDGKLAIGRAFQRGLVVCNSSTAPTLTIGAADCWFDVQYV